MHWVGHRANRHNPSCGWAYELDDNIEKKELSEVCLTVFLMPNIANTYFWDSGVPCTVVFGFPSIVLALK